MRALTGAFCCALAVLLSACASPTPQAPSGGLAAGQQDASVEARQVGPVETARWAGRFSVTVTAYGIADRNERASGRFLLESAAQQTVLELFSPLGQTIATAVLTPGEASLRTAEGAVFEAESAEELTAQALGWRIPVAGLPRWLRGELAGVGAAPNAPVFAQEDNWNIRLDDWRKRSGQRAQPGRLALDWPAAITARTDASRKINLRLIVDDPLSTEPASSAASATR